MIGQMMTLAVAFLALALWGGGIYLVFALICKAYDFHLAGMARVRAYDLQQKANKTNPYLLTTQQEKRNK